jgi:two-component sensor histidine kinase/ligand-binding sensor domain-containing protein
MNHKMPLLFQLLKQLIAAPRKLCWPGFTVGCFLLSAPGTFAQGNSDYTITKRLLSVEDGLASHEVFCGLQDTAGFMWFGTRNGLNRYDGKHTLLFTRQRNQLQDNKVVRIAKDDANHLFIEYGSTGFQLTTNGKVDIMDATTHEVQTMTAAFPDLPFKERDVYWISNDGSDEISMLTAHPFRYWTYSSKKGFRLRCEMKDWEKVAFPIDYHTTGPLCSFVSGRALLKITNQNQQYFVTPDTVIAFRQTNVLRSLPIGFTNNNEVLITYNKAANPDVFVVDVLSAKGQLAPVPDLAKYQLEPVKGRYWYQAGIATDGSASFFYIANDALYLWNKDAFVKVLDKSEQRGFENMSAYQLLPDALGNLWACTSLGVLQLKLKKNRFKPYFTTSQQSIEPNSQARGIAAGPEGRVTANIWTHTFSRQAGHTQAIRHDAIQYALVRHGSALYSGSYELSRYDEAGNQATVIPGGLGSEIWSMYSFNDSLLLLGRSTGLAVFNSRTSRIDSLPMAGSSTPPPRFVYRFFKDNAGTVWAVAENGLYAFRLSSGRLLISKLQSNFLSGLSLLDAYRDAGGAFWLATNGEGLYRWDPKTDAAKQFNITAGFPSDVLYRIEPDTFGNLWISSDYGLIRFNPKRLSVHTYTTIDGISNNEFNRTSSFRAADGRLYFGGLNGVNGFDPRDFAADTTDLRVPLRITAFNQFVGESNELVNNTTELLRNTRIVLEPDDRFFTLDFQLLDFTKDEGHRYAYKIEGLDKDWNYISENSVRISGLPFGDFTLRIKAQNREGAWNRLELSIPVQVLKPVYLQWWFIAAVFLLLLLAIYLLVRWRLRQLARDKRILEETVNERTMQLKHSLSEQSALLLEKDVLMKEIHHRVKNNLQVISGLLELQGKTLTDETAKEALQEGRNRVRSIALIHQNLYQFENLSSIDLKQFVTDLCRQVQSVYQTQKNIAVSIDVPAISLDIDSAIPLGLILNELLSNSFKYAFNDWQEGGITLAISPLGGGRYMLSYTDTGPGLPLDFDPSKATTLGLQLVNDLARQIGGKVRYAAENGTSFSINFTNRDVRRNQD